MRHAKLLLLSPTLLLFLAAGEARALVGVEVKLWRPDTDLEAKSSTDALKGTNVDFDSDLDMDTLDEVPYVKGWFGGRHRIVASIWKVKLSGEDFPDVTFDFGGETFTIGVEVESELKTTVYRVAWETDWISSPNLRFGTIFGTEIFDAEVSVENDLVGKEKADIKAPIPIVGLQGEIGLPYGLGAYGEIAGLWIDSGDFKGGFYEWELGVKYNIIDKGPLKIYASAGFRQLKVDVEEDDDEVEIDVRGFTFGVGARF